MIFVVIASLIGIAVMAFYKMDINETGKIKMPLSFWAYVAWCVAMCIASYIL